MPADEEPVDKYLNSITESCKPKCVPTYQAYEACLKRQEKKKDADCEPWYFDYWKCIDKCRVPQLMKTLK